MPIPKPLRDKVDGDKFSLVRQYPSSFLRSANEKAYSLPMISWNAKITRVYKLNHLVGMTIQNLDALLGIE